MSEQNENKSAAQTGHTVAQELWKIREIEIPLTYPALEGATVVFPFKVLMNREEKESRQIFSGLTAEEKDARRRDYNLELATSLITRFPEGLPGVAVETGSLEDSKIKFRELFSQDYPMLEQMLEDALGLYFIKVLPREYLQKY